MIFVDYRAGSKELIEPLRKLGVEVEKTTLDYGDLMWEGRGEKGAPVLVGVEFKQLRELVQALRSERLQGYQMKGMRDTYKYSYLMVEDPLMYDRGGMLLRRAGRHRLAPMAGQMTVQELLKRKNVLHLCGGLNPIFTQCRKDSLQEILALYRTWTDVDLDKHKSHIAAYEAPSLITISDVRRTLKTLPHIGNRASLAVEQHFGGNLARALNAHLDEWAGIMIVDDKGKQRRLGLKVAQAIVEYCHGVK
jgi:ERCC4-type nuclease